MQKLVLILLCLLTFFSGINAQEKGWNRWKSNIERFESADQKLPPPQGANLFVGSSSIAKWKDIAHYFPGYTVINRGFGGSTYQDLLFYVDRVIIPYKPAKVFIYEGDNDIARGVTSKKIMKRLKRIIKILKAQLPETEVAIIGVKPSISRWRLADQYIALNEQMKNFASRTKKVEFLDVWSPMLDQHGQVFQHIFLKDKLHMNAEGYEIWKEIIQPSLIK